MSLRARGAGLAALLAPTLAMAADIVVHDPGAALSGLGVDVRAGDVLVGWRNETGDFVAPADALAAWEIEFARAPHGPVSVRMRRDGKPHEIELPGGRWDWVLEAGHDQPEDGRTRAARAIATIRASSAMGAWDEAEHRCATPIDARVDAAVLDFCTIAFEANPDRRAGVAMARRLVAARVGAPPALRARAALALARSTFAARDYIEAERAARDALALAGGDAARSTTAAGALQVLGFVDYRRGALDDADADYRRAGELLAALAPGSVQHASVLGAQATVLGSRGALDEAVGMAADAIARMRRVAPAQMALGRLQYNAGLMSFERGRLADAERFLADAAETFAHASPRGAELAMSRAQLAQTFERRGESGRAETLLRTAIAASAAIDATSYETLSMRLQLAITLDALGRGGEAEAETVAVLAATGDRRDDTLYADALALHAQRLRGRGEAAQALVEADAAIALLRPRDRRIQLAGVLLERGEALRELGRHEEAAAALGEALALRRQLAPHTALEADALRALARLHARRGDAASAAAAHADALDALEAQRDLLGGSEESHARWAARAAPFYREALAERLEQADTDAAWTLLDRYRAREFIATLGRRRDALLDHVEPTLALESRAIAEGFLRAQRAAREGMPADGAFDALRARAAALARRLVDTDPRLASVLPLLPARATDVAAALPADAVLVSYAVLPERSWAFVVRPGTTRAEVVALEIDAATLAREVDALRLLITLPDAGSDSTRALERRAAALHARLVAPLAAATRDARRWLVVADGALHRLPFAALREADGRWFGERHALTTLASASAWLAQSRNDAVPASRQSIAVLAASDAGEALPAAEAEAESIAVLFAPRARIDLGAAATPARALAALAEADIVHVASHAVVDPGDPLHSHLRLGGAGAQLSAWQIMQAPLLRADLVTLSACDSALGLNAGGDGLLGLTEAFRYAGARAVVASLWRVSDEATRRFMTAFYSALASGEPRDLALAHARRTLSATAPAWWQQSLGIGADFRHPYFWSAFVLTGAPQ